ncbi:MAG: glycosyltransferase family 4 protein [Syntrophaceae bacterium]|nr:glycosyltransferase family 4 protein [Syntrophaceae bacterium]
MDKIRFATAILDFSRRRGGAERYLVDLCSRMVHQGFEVHVYAEHWGQEESGIHFHQVKTIPFPKSLRLLSFAVRATREIEKGNYDITLGVGNTLKADILQPHGGVHWAWFWRSLRAYDNPFLWSIKFLGRVLSPKQWVQGYIENAPYKKRAFKKIVAISDMVKEDIIRWYGIPEDQIEVIYNGVDIERFHPRNRQYREEVRRRHGIGDELVILFVSNNFRMKGLGFLLKALAEIKKGDSPHFKLLILGRDRKKPYLLLAERLALSEEVIFAGSTDEPEKYYGAADLLVHPAFYDAFSLSVLEALASGLPVITTASAGASGILNHGEDGFVLRKIVDLEELKTAIRYFFDEGIRQRASHLGRTKAEMYSHQSNFSAIDQVLKNAIQIG